MTNSADTYGWDTAFGIYFADANAAIIRKKSSPTSFSVTSTGSWINATLKGTFSDWQLVAGGDGEDVHMQIPIATATLSSPGKPDIVFACGAKIEIQLKFLPQPDPTNSAPIQNLVVNLTSNDNQDPIVSVLSLSNVVPNVDDSALTTITTLLQTWLQNNLQQFDHVFAAVNFAPTTADSSKWMIPTYTSYAVIDSSSSTNYSSVFGVLAMTENRPVLNLAHQLSPYTIPDGANSGFLIASERFLEKLMLPGVILLFLDPTTNKVPTTDKFDVSGDSITNLVPLKFQDVELPANKTATPHIDAGNFSITLKSTELLINFTDFNFEWSPGITVHTNYTATATMSLNNSNQLKLIQANCQADGAVEASQAIEWTEIATTIGGAVLGAVIGGFVYERFSGGNVVPQSDTSAVIETMRAQLAAPTNEYNNLLSNTLDSINTAITELKAAANSNAEPTSFSGLFSRVYPKLLAAALGAVIGATIGALPSILEDIANDETDKIPKLDSFAADATSAVTWPTATGYTLTSATLNDSLQLGGKLNFDSSAT